MESEDAEVISIHSRSRWRDKSHAEIDQLARWMRRDGVPIPHDFRVEVHYRAWLSRQVEPFEDWYARNYPDNAPSEPP